jgi:hypothetical protein
MAGVKVTDLPVLATTDPEDVLYIVDTSDNLSKQIAVEDFLGYKVYTALLTQSGTDAPIATVLKNTLGGEIVFTYDNIGIYTGTLTGAFTENKTFILINQTAFENGPDYQNYGDWYSINTIRVTTAISAAGAVDSQLRNTSIEIRVYN